jgi:hypothetical protein
MATFNHWAYRQLYGWALDSLDEFRNYVNQNSGIDFDEYVNDYKRGVYDNELSKLFEGGAVNFNLGGENDKSKLEFTDRPIGVFDFSLASQQLFRVHEFYSDKLRQEQPDLFASYNVSAGVVPNYFVDKITVQGVNNFVYKDVKTNTDYICVRRQKGLTKLIEQQPNLQTKIQEGTGLIIPAQPTNKVKFASKTKKPYLKYKKQGGKVRYVEIYSAHYYTRMNGNFQYAVRHIPVLMAAEYLEKMGTLTKIYATRFVIPDYQTGNRRKSNVPIPLEKDKLTNIGLPLYSEWIKTGRVDDGAYVVMPMCVKEYGAEINKERFFAVASQSFKELYESSFANMNYHEVEKNNLYPYGNPNWSEPQYQEAFERFRQKFIRYSNQGIWKAKEIVPQGMIYFHDLVLNINFNNHMRPVINAFRDANGNALQIHDLIRANPSVNKWFETWMRISAFTIKDKFDIFNTNKPTKVYRDIIKHQQSVVQEIEFMIKAEQNTLFKNYLNDVFLPMVLQPTTYLSNGNIDMAGYSYSDSINYISQKINEMTIYAAKGIFATPDEQIEKRNEIAERLYDELTKI